MWRSRKILLKYFLERFFNLFIIDLHIVIERRDSPCKFNSLFLQFCFSLLMNFNFSPINIQILSTQLDRKTRWNCGRWGKSREEEMRTNWLATLMSTNRNSNNSIA